MDDFYAARRGLIPPLPWQTFAPPFSPGDSIQTMNVQLAKRSNLLITPGMYDMARGPRHQAPRHGRARPRDRDADGAGWSHADHHQGQSGIVVAGLTVDAGPVMSDVLVQVGKTNGTRGSAKADPANPITLGDVYFRVGGPYVGKTDTALRIDSSHVLVDHTWVWRADHGVEGFDRTDGAFGDNERWRTNIGNQGPIVNGDDVTATGLFVEHFQKYNTTWNGEHGRVYLYQNELPFDPPSQADWIDEDGDLGWAAYKVADDVQEHLLWGGGVYVFNRNDPSIVTENGYEAPANPGISLNHLMTKNLSGPGTILSVVNGIGGTVDGVPVPGDPDDYEDPEYVISFP